MLRIGAAQVAPVFLDPAATTDRALAWIDRAAEAELDLLAFGETFLPGYPFWLEHTGGAEFGSALQRDAYRWYLERAVRVDGPELAAIAERARKRGVFVVMGIAERGPGPGSGSVYCTAVPICPERGLLTPHRKLVPTYEERLVWAQGDGHGLRPFDVKGVRVSVLNCWENWMPQARHALYAQGAELHVSLWPGSLQNTRDITRFVAMEGRVFSLAAAGVLRRGDVPAEFPAMVRMPDGRPDDWLREGGSCVAGPDGEWIVEPVGHREELVVASIDLADVSRARQTFDPTGHYSRPDVFDVRVDRRRRCAASFHDGA